MLNGIHRSTRAPYNPEGLVDQFLSNYMAILFQVPLIFNEIYESQQEKVQIRLNIQTNSSSKYFEILRIKFLSPSINISVRPIKTISCIIPTIHHSLHAAQSILTYHYVPHCPHACIGFFFPICLFFFSNFAFFFCQC